MSSRLPCVVSIEEARRSDEEGFLASLQAEKARIAGDVGNELEAFIRSQYGVSAWSPALAVLEEEIAEYLIANRCDDDLDSD